MLFKTELLTRTRTLWVLFVATILLAICFKIAEEYWNLILIDAVFSPAEARNIIASFDYDQRIAHVWITATLDVVYPLTYGGLFAGSALRFFPRYHYLALPGFLAIPTDLLEGLVQVLALLNVVDWLTLKVFLTPSKMILFYAGGLIMVSGWVVWLFDRWKERS